MSSTPSDPQPQGPTWGSPQQNQHSGAAGSPPPYGGYAQPGAPGHPPAGQPGPHAPVGTSQDERTMATIAHLSTIAALILSAGWLSFVGPLVVWAMYKDRSPFVRESAAGAFNFNLGITLFAIVGWILTLTLIGAIVGIPMILIAAVLQVVYHVIGAVRANRGELFRYPMQLRILS